MKNRFFPGFIVILILIFAGCPQPVPVPEPEPGIEPVPDSISVKIEGVIPASGCLLLQDADRKSLAVLQLGSTGIYTFTAETYNASQSYPFQVLFFQDYNADKLFNQETETASAFNLATIDFRQYPTLTTQLPAQTITHYQGNVQFHPDMGSDPAHRYIYLVNRQDGYERLLPVDLAGAFDFYDKGYSNAGRLYLYALYDADGNAQADLFTDAIAIVDSPVQAAAGAINAVLVKLSGLVDTGLHTVSGNEQLLIESNDLTAQSIMFHTIHPDGLFDLFVSKNHYLGLSLYKMDGLHSGNSIDKILQKAAYLGVLSNPVPYQESGYVTVNNFNMETIREWKALFLYNPYDDLSNSIMHQAEAALVYSKFQYAVMDLNSNTLLLSDLETYQVVMIATEYVSLLDTNEISDLKTYVNRGGGLVVLTRGWNQELNSLVGVANTVFPGYAAEETAAGDGEPNNQYDYGLEYISAFFPGINGLKEEVWISYLDYALEPGAEVIMRGIRSHAPLLWRFPYGSGSVLYWNNTRLSDFYYRGMILQSLLDVQEAGIMPIIGARTFIIDDFPMSMYNTVQEPVKTEYNNMNQQDFYTNIWLPDLLGLAAAYNMKYTFAVPFNYSEETVPPWDDVFNTEWLAARNGSDEPLCPIIGRQLRDAGHELALHGYNHIPLMLTPAYEEAPVWADQATMVSALQAAKTRWILDFGALPVSYIPPLNKYDITGLHALETVFPTIRNICGALDSTGDNHYYNEGFRSEFAYEGWDSHFITLPRYTAGYLFNMNKKAAVISQLSLMGLWTHYAHPDDIYDTLDNAPGGTDPAWLRNPDNLNWRADKNAPGDGLYFQLSALLQWVTAQYPWLRLKQTRDLNRMIPEYSNANVVLVYKTSGNILQAEVFSDNTDAYFMLRVKQGNSIKTGGLSNLQQLHEETADGYTFYILKLTAVYGQVTIVRG